MERNPIELASRTYDLVVVGGGIFGICAAWDAVLRGLSVALIERGDFAHAASANCFKIVHGGVRYLQHADVVRMRHSSRERGALLRVAPHQVEPLPIAVPTYGHGRHGKALLGAGFKLYDLVTCDRNRGVVDAARRIPPSRLISRAEALDLFPGLDPHGLTGAALFHDGHMYSPARLALCFLLAAAARGLEASNYTEATRFLVESGRVVGVEARDTLSDAAFEVRGRVVLNATGGWAPGLVSRGAGRALDPQPSFSRDACFVARRRIGASHALAVQGRTRDPDALLSRGARHLFLVPWRDRTLVGVWHVVYRGEPDRAAVSEAELQGFIDEANAAYPALELTLADVALTQCGLVLFGENRAGAENLSYGKRSRLLDHARDGGPEGLLTLIGVRYTTARSDAAQAVDRVFAKLGQRAPASQTERAPVYGGNLERFDALVASSEADRPREVGREAWRALLRNHGSEYRRVTRWIEAENGVREMLGDSTTLRAEVLQAAREEMARTLADVVFRRTDLGTAGDPGAAALEEAADVMAAELGWNPSRRGLELEAVRAAFPAGAPA